MLLQKYLLSSALHPGIYRPLPLLFLLHTFNIAPSSLLPSFPALRSEGRGFILSSSRFEIAAPASSSRATTGAGHGLGCGYPELLHCSCVRLSSTTGSVTQHRAPARTCRSWLMPGRTGLRGGQKQLQPWSPTGLGSAVANSCILGNACGSGNVQYPSSGHLGVHCACLGTCRRSTEGISVGVAGVSRIQACSLQQAPEYLARGQGSHNSCAPLLMA